MADGADMDLVVLIDDPSANLESSFLVQMIGDLLQRVSTALRPISPPLEREGSRSRVDTTNESWAVSSGRVL